MRSTRPARLRTTPVPGWVFGFAAEPLLRADKAGFTLFFHHIA
jgi:hypothetical protein